MTWDDMKLATWDGMKVVTCFDLTCDDVKLVYLVNLYKVTCGCVGLGLGGPLFSGNCCIIDTDIMGK